VAAQEFVQSEAQGDADDFYQAKEVHAGSLTA
jgi:hypothetical protein